MVQLREFMTEWFNVTLTNHYLSKVGLSCIYFVFIHLSFLNHIALPFTQMAQFKSNRKVNVLFRFLTSIFLFTHLCHLLLLTCHSKMRVSKYGTLVSFYVLVQCYIDLSILIANVNLFRI